MRCRVYQKLCKGEGKYWCEDVEGAKEAFDEIVQMYGSKALSSREAVAEFNSRTGLSCSYQAIVNAWNRWVVEQRELGKEVDDPRDSRKRAEKAYLRAKKGEINPRQANARERRALAEVRREKRDKKVVGRKKALLSSKIDRTSKHSTSSKTGRIVSEEELLKAPTEVVKEIEEKVVFQPNAGPQTDFLAAPETDVLYGGQAGGGKVVKRGDSISTPFGWKKIEDVKVGDLISNPSGGVQKIIQLHPWISYNPTRVSFSDGTFVDVHEDHLWQAWRARKSVKKDGERITGYNSREVVETRTLRDWLDKGESPQIPVTQPIVFNTTTKEKDKIPAYLMGVLLGDGCITSKSITIASHEDDQEHLSKYLPYGDDVVYKGQMIRFRGHTRKWIEEKLVLHKLFGTRSSNKFIPRVYKYAPLKERWELVRGLMDTDGYSAPDKNGCYYTSISKTLAYDMAEVLRSLGCVVSISTKEGKYRDKEGEIVVCHIVYELYIKSRNDSELFNLPRKKTNRPTQEISKRVVGVEQLSTTATGRCITVSGVEGLYCTTDYIVTHNSYALIIDPLRYIHRAAHRALILRKTMPELREIIDKTRELYPQAVPGCKYKEVEKRWIFPSGATIEFGYLERDADVYRYQGQAYSLIAFDELTHLATEFPWNYLASRLRTTDPEIECYLRATTNPGGVGHMWVKSRYIDPASPNTTFVGADGLTRKFIPATLHDNPYLAKDGNYERMLRSLPEVQRRRLLEGDWNINEGAAFPEFSNYHHVIDPFTIPPSWVRVKGVDYGYASPSAVVWGALDPSDDTLIIYKELYQKGLTGEDLGQRIVELEAEERRSIPGVLDTAAWNRTGYTGPTIGETLNREPYMLKLRPADKNRIAGKVAIHQRLKRRIMPDGELGRPKLQIFSTCKNLIRELYTLPLSETNSEDVDTKAEDHAYDALRYLVMSRPSAATAAHKQFHIHTHTWSPSDAQFGY